MAYPHSVIVDDGTIFQALGQTAKNGGLVCLHAENGSVIDVMVARALAEGKTAPIYHALTRPVQAEAEAVHRSIALPEMAGAPVYIVHVSSADALDEVREARDRGVPAQGRHCAGKRRRRGDSGSRGGPHHQRKHTSHAGGLLDV